MPLNPSPEELTTLRLTLSSIWIARWDDGEQRELVVIPYDSEPGLDAGPFVNGDPDYDHAAQFITVDELDELIQVLQDQRGWLRGDPQWVVTRTMLVDGVEVARTIGPYPRETAERIADDLIRVSSPDTLSVVVTQLERGLE